MNELNDSIELIFLLSISDNKNSYKRKKNKNKNKNINKNKMSSAPVRLDDRGMFKPNGLFEYVEERPNSVPLADTIAKQLKFQEQRRLTGDEILEVIQEARNRPRFQSFRRLQELAREENEKKEEEQKRTDVLNMSLKNFWWNTSDRMNGILDDVANFEEQKSLYDIFMKGDRLIYLGIVIIVIAFLILLIYMLEIRKG